MARFRCALLLCLMLLSLGVRPERRRLVVIDQDGSGPGGSNQLSMLVLLQAPEVQVLGIGMVTGNAWMEEQTQHTLRMLERVGRADVPVHRGATWPLVRNMAETLEQQRYHGKVAWLGAWGGRWMDKPTPVHAPDEVPPLPEGMPSTPAAEEDAAHFLVRTVREHPHQVSVFALGPLTNLALAQRIDPQFAALARELVMMGGSLSPDTEDDEFTTSPQHEFNLWFDPEAAHIVLSAPWKRIVATTVDVSIKTWMTDAMVEQIARSKSPAANYVVEWSRERFYMWDEITTLAWLYPEIITATRSLYLDADLGRGPNYGHTLAWTEKLRPERDRTQVSAQVDLNVEIFNRRFVELISAPAAR